MDWFEKNYKLEDKELSEELFDYICHNLHNYGYKWTSICHSKKGKKYVFDKI